MVYVYTITKDGEPRERQGEVVRKGKDFHLIEIGNQRICLPAKATTIHNDAMWTNVSQKNVYIQKMIEILLDRKQKHLDAANACERKIQRLKRGWE